MGAATASCVCSVRGGQGQVWHAFDLKLRVEVALKALRPDLIRDERARELLRHEVRTARQVVSPNVCRVFDLVMEDGHEMVSMEFVDGTTLAELLLERGPLDLSRAGEIAAQLLAGLEAIHAVGLVHRDLKPENIMLTLARRVVVMDFGIARSLTEQRAGTSCGHTRLHVAGAGGRDAARCARRRVLGRGGAHGNGVARGGHARGPKKDLGRAAAGSAASSGRSVEPGASACAQSFAGRPLRIRGCVGPCPGTSATGTGSRRG